MTMQNFICRSSGSDPFDWNIVFIERASACVARIRKLHSVLIGTGMEVLLGLDQERKNSDASLTVKGRVGLKKQKYTYMY